MFEEQSSRDCGLDLDVSEQVQRDFVKLLRPFR